MQFPSGTSASLLAALAALFDDRPADQRFHVREGPGEPPAPALNGSAWPTIDLFRTDAEPVAAASEPAVAEPASAEPVLAADPELVVDAPSDATPPADFWAHPFTGFAPVVEPTNGHDPEVTGAC